MSATLKYDGLLPKAELVGFGHFAPGEEKTIDDYTAVQMDCETCKAEGWTVTFDEKRKKSADTESVKPALEPSPRGSRNQAHD
jgi:hypothetical protein